MAFDVISIGDSVVDTFIPLTEADIYETKDGPMLGMGYGKKIPVGDARSFVAGNAANNAVGSARLKLKVAIYTNVGNGDDDKDDLRIINKLKAEKVDLRYVVENDNLPSNHNIVLTFKGERTILVHHQPWKFKLPELDTTKWVYLTSMSPSYTESNIIDELIHYLERTGAKLLYNPGTFQLKNGVKKTPRLLSLTELFIVNKEEAMHILGHKHGDSINIKKLLKGVSDLGPKMVIITDGKDGSYGFDGEKYYRLEPFPATLMEMTGAGDSYATGCMAGLIHGKELPEAMRWGGCNSASVVEQIGAQAGLLTYSQMIEKLKNKRVQTKLI